MKTKSILGLVALFVLVAMPNVMMATPSACVAGTYASLIATDSAGGCYIQVGANNFLLFTGFTDTPGVSTGTGSPVNPADIGVTILNGVPTVTTGPTGSGFGGVQNIYGFDFNPAGTLDLSGIGSEDITLSYNVQAVTSSGAAINEIDSVHEAITASILPAGSGLAESSETDTACSTVTGCTSISPAPLIVNEPTPPGTAEADYVGVGPYDFLTVSKDITLTTYSSSSTANISLVADGVDLTSPVPEPASLAYLALGCLGLLGAARRRRQAK